MHNICVFGKALKETVTALKAAGYKTNYFSSMDALAGGLDTADCVLIEPGTKKPAKSICAAMKCIPTIVLTDTDNPKPCGTWLNEPLTYSIASPTEQELLKFVRRILSENESATQSAAAEKELSMMSAELSFFQALTRLLTTSNSVDDIFVLLLKRIRELIGAEALSIYIYDTASGDLVCRSTLGKVRKGAHKIRMKPGEGLAGIVAMKSEPMIMASVSKSHSHDHATTASKVMPYSCMATPMVIETRVLGVVEVINKKDGTGFTEDDLQILVNLTDQGAFALERIDLHQRLEDLVVTDDLTKLFNTRYLHRSLETEIARSERYSSSVALIFMDLDHFKNVNDTYGHLIGSKLLVELAGVLIGQLRTIDIVSRYGGDEFVLVLPQTSLSNAMSIAERIRQAIEQNVFLAAEGINLKITSSFGVAAYPESAHSKQDLIRIADESMYRVKKRTRNGVYAII